MFARVGSLGVNNLGSIYRVPLTWHPQHLGSRFLPYAPPGLLNQDFTVCIRGLRIQQTTPHTLHVRTET